MSVFAVSLLLILATLLTVSAASKLAQPAIATRALVELGLRPSAAGVIVAGVIVMEETIAAALVLWPHALASQAAGIALFGGFALVAAVAIRGGRAVDCGCFGALRRSRLGWLQILQFIAVTPGVIFAGRFAPVWDIQSGVVVLLSVHMAVATLLFAPMCKAWWRIRRERVSLGSARIHLRRVAPPRTELAEAGGGVA
jgi:Methylamine utilisation protein MauE